MSRKKEIAKQSFSARTERDLVRTKARAARSFRDKLTSAGGAFKSFFVVRARGVGIEGERHFGPGKGRDRTWVLLGKGMR